MSSTPEPTPPPSEDPAPRQQSIWHNWLSLAGGALAGSACFAFLLLVLFDLGIGGGGHNAYLGLLTYGVAPTFLFLGIGTALLGAWLQARHRAKGRQMAAPSLAIDLSRPADRRKLGWFVAGTSGFLMLTALGSYQTYHFTESVEFCGEMCHTVMQPEFVRYQHGEHARVACVECHIGSGAGWYVKAKLNGLHQVYALTMNSFNRPIPTPVRNLRPARDTCEHCHWPEKFSGNVERTYNHFLGDDDNTPYTVGLLLKVGGGTLGGATPPGSHWHIDNKVEYYASDMQRQSIPWVRVTRPDGTTTVYRTEDFRGDPPTEGVRTMDCMDCHNRPAHRYTPPNDAVERSIYLGRLDKSLASIKSVAVGLLTETYTTSEDAHKAIDEGLHKAYEGNASVDAAVKEVESIYDANFFPIMKADWSHYPENIGHKNSPGCFRCHDSNHTEVATGRTISSTDCNSCHVIIAQGKGDQMSELSSMGLKFEHPGDEIPEGLTCTDCHNGKNQSP